MAAFTLATSDREVDPEDLVAELKDVVQLAGLYFHTHVAVSLIVLPQSNSPELN